MPLLMGTQRAGAKELVGSRACATCAGGPALLPGTAGVPIGNGAELVDADEDDRDVVLAAGLVRLAHEHADGLLEVVGVLA